MERAAEHTNVIDAYAADFRVGMRDLSAPSPAPLPLPLREQAIADADLEFATPGGSHALRQAVAERYTTLSADDVLITNGGSEALAALAAALTSPGSRIALAAGTYASFTEVARLAGGQLLPWDDRPFADVVVANNPTVPGGQRLDVAMVLHEADQRGAIVIVDEVYRAIALAGEVPEAAADLSSRAISVGDLSKSLGLGGLRIGWIASHNAELRAKALKWLRLFTGGPSVLSELAALEALGTFDERIAAHTNDARANAPLVYEQLRAADWSFAPAALGVTVEAFPPHALARSALRDLRERGAFLVSGEAFGRPGGVRISLLTPPQALGAALRRLTPAHERDVLVLLTRVPQPGFGKSRIAASLGIDMTHRLARAFVQDTARLTEGRWRTIAAYTPAAAGAEAAMLVPSTEMLAQTDGDLGDRIRHALERALSLGERAVLIGSDTPDLPRRIIEEAFDALDDADVVYGPAQDGGFYLIGVRATHPEMFEGIEWSTDSVQARAAMNAHRLGWRVVYLEEWEDVDDYSSLLALARRIEGTERAAATQAVLAAIGVTAGPA